MFETSQVGLMVYDLTADQVLYERNSRQLMRPASTMKLLTAITALDYLGSDYLFSTRLHYTGQIDNGVLRGNIFCVGGFDPMVSDGDINAMAGNLRAMGIDRVEGYIVADQSMKDTLSYGEGWCWDDKNPRLLPLTVGRKDVFPERLQRELADVGVATDAVVLANGTCPVQSTLVCQSCHTMDQVLERMMKMSDNFYAEAMFYQIAAAAGKGPARADAAVEVVRQLIRRLGLDDSIYRIADGSGLSLYNYLSAELETQLLRYAWRNGHIYAHLAPSLPVAGVDGTLKKRMLKTAAKGNVHAKTGTLTGISSLAGYCTAANGHTLAFAIINQGVMQSQRAKSFQDRVCTALCETE
jgi:D-alanyl-D-alanine carboxypeptidase/D-alanyl-D-alanine-endopeptidase (penicillin-binding protein 4)